MGKIKYLSQEEFYKVVDNMKWYPFHMCTRNYRKAIKKVMGNSEARPTEEQRFWIEHAYMEYERRSEEYKAMLEKTHLCKWPTIQLMNMVRSNNFYYNQDTLGCNSKYIYELHARGYIVGWRQGQTIDYVIDFAKVGTDKARHLIPIEEW